MAYAKTLEVFSETSEKARVKSSFLKNILSGIVAGQIAGLIMAVVMMLVFAVFLGKSPLYPVQVIGAFVFGNEALQGFHFPALVAGLLLHQLGPSLFWGAALGVITYFLKVPSGAPFVFSAVALGLLSQAIDVNLIMPFAMTALHGHNIWAEQVPVFWSWAAHLVFGLGLLVYPRILKRITGQGL